ncbi:MAG: thioredoxin [Marinifilaceae bacterium]
MKKLFILFALIVISLTYGYSQTVKNISTEDFKKQIWDYTTNKEWKYLGDKPVIIDLYADWCPPCKKLAPILEELQKEYGKKIQIYKIDVDKNPAIAQLFAARSIPMLVFIPTQGEPTKMVGLQPKEQLKKIIDEKLLNQKK